ncbi:hypothetical protein [Aliikangiella coralliicola]|uniref:Baseplate protein J-like domain-containing protein n=1 Tax=Aliikangiella coralliicola TaxID=2592383 RepID=A0A545UE58_9GAMM|nr:hypothetical protein [Aliikangiella coralliicola]TQV87760.1 hypothetical protein FLL46_10260 [Aliikangiella coralliicola]
MNLPDRIELIRQSNIVTGIDFIQVSDDQLELFVFLHHLELPAPLDAALTTITAEEISITALNKIEPEEVLVVQHVTPIPTIDNRRALRLQVEQPGGFGYYQLSIFHGALDSYFNHIPFTFKAGCESEFDCKQKKPECPPEPSNDFPVDYRSRDFWSFRQVLTDFASQRYPDWQDRLEADMGMMLVELYSAMGDEFSYAQDRIKRETNFADATQRRTLRHFAQLVDYPIDNGSGASTWIDVTANANGALAAGTALTDIYSQQVFEIGNGLADLGTNFNVSPDRNEFMAYIWDENDTCLPRGSDYLTIAGHHAADFLPDSDIDPVGKWVLLATRPTEPDLPERRLMVRVVDTDEDIDPVTGDLVTEIIWDNPTQVELDLTTLVVRGNLLPATSGETIPPVDQNALRFRIGPANDPFAPDADLPLAIERAGANTCYSNRQDEAGRVKFVFSLPDSHTTPLVWLPTDRSLSGGASASESNLSSSLLTRPEVLLQREPNEDWQWMPSMISEEVAGPTDAVFTLEEGTYRALFSVERFGEKFSFDDYATSDGFSVRFGDGEFGLAPRDGDIFALRYRLGNGRLSNVSADTLIRFKSEFDDPPIRPAFVDAITNPLAASGGRDAETSAQIKTNAPEAYKAITYRAVQPGDYTEITERLDWVQQAGTHFRWTGSWPTVFVTPDPFDQVGITVEQKNELDQLLDRVRQVGRETCVKQPVYANIDLEIKVCVDVTAYPGQVKERVLLALFGNGNDNVQGEYLNEKNGIQENGTLKKDTPPWFFHPDNFTFGTPLSRAALITAIQQVAGVHAVNGIRIRRRGWFDWRSFSEFCYRVAVNELILVTNNALLPEQGAVRLIMEGGA